MARNTELYYKYSSSFRLNDHTDQCPKRERDTTAFGGVKNEEICCPKDLAFLACCSVG